MRAVRDPPPFPDPVRTFSGRERDEIADMTPRVARRHARSSEEESYLSGSPVIARAITSRWISLVPSKMVKIFASRCQRSTG